MACFLAYTAASFCFLAFYKAFILFYFANFSFLTFYLLVYLFAVSLGLLKDAFLPFSLHRFSTFVGNL